MNAIAKLVDKTLEATVVGSFSKIGYETRKRLEHWTEPGPLPGRSVIVTGATSGLGFETSVELARLGASVTFVARDLDRARRARESIAALSGRDDVSFLLGDMADLESIRNAAHAYLSEHDTIDLLIHNAGSLSKRYEKAPNGTELTVATHVLGPFLLTGLLLPALRRPRLERGGPARVLTVSSGGMYSHRFDLDRLEFGPGGFKGVDAYARAKRAQVVLNHEWASRVNPREVVFHAMHPGWVDTPGIRSSLPGFFRTAQRVLRTPQQGVDTLVWLSQAPEAVHTSGQFWLDRQPRSEHKLPWTRTADPARDQARLWDWCATRTGWTDPA
jgi:dehydrogenase/reductase SDR family member 12